MSAGLETKRVLVVGAGGLGCAAAPVLARSGVGFIDLADDDRIELSNLQRQLLYHERDVGRTKVQIGAARLLDLAAAAGHSLKSVAREIRVIPDNATALVGDYDLVLEGADNFATKFLIADACAIAGVPLIQSGAVRWNGWALGSIPGTSACLRCVFEDIPRDQTSCAAAGVVGPVVGVLGALQASIAIRLLLGASEAAGELWSFEGLSGALRVRRVDRQQTCRLCAGLITDTRVSRYMPPERAA